ncbi:MAG: DUF932 domain-containing protein [Deltaproteobacteria bacterium]|nr:DUF932 domain-containing protein [Deltaproteobacteria bacterium]
MNQLQTNAGAAAPTNLYHLSRQWASRPDDERFVTLEGLRAAVALRTENVRTVEIQPKELYPDIVGRDVVLKHRKFERLDFTHWSFGQTAQVAKAPAAYLRRLPPELTTALLTHGLRVDSDKGESAFYYEDQGEGAGTLRAVTSPSYGRIFDLDVVDAVMRLNQEQGGRWVVPASSYTSHNPKRATTLYASDRDVFCFLCDPANPIQIPGQQAPSYRGFIVSNSETGSASFKLMLMLYEKVCDNRIIWGARHVEQLSIRHNAGAPARFLREAAPALEDYAERSVEQEVQAIERAQNLRLKTAAPGEGSYEDILRWVRERTGIAKGIIEDGWKQAQTEEGKVDTAWDMVQGITAAARSIPHTDSRIAVEQAATKLIPN